MMQADDIPQVLDNSADLCPANSDFVPQAGARRAFEPHPLAAWASVCSSEQAPTRRDTPGWVCQGPDSSIGAAAPAAVDDPFHDDWAHWAGPAGR